MRNLEELKQQGRILLDEKRDEFVKQRLLSDEFFEMIQKNKKPMDLLMSYYQCASMEIETKFRVLNQEYSLEYDRNPIESIKTRIKSYESILKKIRSPDVTGVHRRKYPGYRRGAGDLFLPGGYL